MKNFNIKKTVSIKEWSSTDVWKRLKLGIDENVGNVSDAVSEAYAVVKKTVDATLAASDTFGLHHEVSEDGDVVLNKFALAKTAAELSKTKALTEEQKVSAREHLLKHYTELDEDPPESLVEGEMSIFDGTIEDMKPEDIALAPGVDLEAIKNGDEDPFEVVVSIPAGKSKRGWDYTPQAMQKIVDFVSGETAPGYLGHQKQEDVNTQFVTPVTHWVGAMWKDGKAYFRGVVDKVAPDLKRWVRSKRITQVSIFGVPTHQIVSGEVQVVDYKLFSIDWTPLHRAGMPSSVVAVGEMAELSSTSTSLLAFDGSHEGLREALATAVRKRFNDKNSYTWIRNVFDAFFVVEHESNDTRQLYKIDYTAENGVVELGEGVEKVVEQRTFVVEQKVGEQGGSGEMTLQEQIAAIRVAIAKKETDLVTVCGEMGFTSDQVVGQFAGEKVAKLTAAAEFGAKLAKSLGFSEVTSADDTLLTAGEMASVWAALGFDKNKPEKPAEVVGEMATAQAELANKAKDKLIVDTIVEKVSGEQAQALVKRMIQVADGSTKEQISGEIDNLLKDETIKDILGKQFVDSSVAAGGSGSQASEHKHLKTKSASI